MKWKATDLRTRLYLIAALILLTGLGSATLIYLTAGDDPGSVLGYIIIDGHAYPVSPDDSKIYRHGLELYGGKWNVVADQFLRWFTGLWQGRSLAFTVAFIAIGISLGFFLAGKNSHPVDDHDRQAE